MTDVEEPDWGYWEHKKRRRITGITADQSIECVTLCGRPSGSGYACAVCMREYLDQQWFDYDGWMMEKRRSHTGQRWVWPSWV